MYEGGAERYDGPMTIDRTRVVEGGIAAIGGPLRVAGQVRGDVAMVNGDVILEPGGSVTGDITVIGGAVRLEGEASVGGTVTTYAASRRDRAWEHDREDRGGWDWDWDWDDEDHDRRRDRRRDDWDRGFSRLAVRAGSSYNRVEGLPVMFGPVIQTAGRNPLRLEALAIWRTESGASLDTDRMGYQVEAQQYLGGDRRFSVGGSAFSAIDPLDPWRIRDLEASLAAAVFHEDYRDYYDRTGWSVFVRAEPVRGLEARVEYRDEEYDSRAAGDPWSLFHGGDDWRVQPLVGEGDLQLLAGSVELDLRADRDDPSEGWYGRVALERPVGGALARPALTLNTPIDDPAPETLPSAEMDSDFTSAFLDLRRYTRVGYQSQLNVRVVGGGSMEGEALPPQYQHTLGGIGTLPGFPAFFGDCGARRFMGRVEEESFYPTYGCDRFALAQVEYRGELSLDFGFGDPDYDDDEWWGVVDIDMSPTWVVFFDAGRGWGYDSDLLGGERNTGTLTDAGLGFLLGDLGIYAALPLSGDVEQEPRFFVRLGRRF